MARAMPEHAIRLRRAWDLESPPGTPAGRIDLPIERLALDAPFRLARAWTTPAALGPDESVQLRLERLAGLVAVEVDGIRLPHAAVLPVAAAPGRRSRLVLSCDPTGLFEAERRDWGHVALLIAPTPPLDPDAL